VGWFEEVEVTALVGMGDVPQIQSAVSSGSFSPTWSTSFASPDVEIDHIAVLGEGRWSTANDSGYTIFMAR
jgi:hypothetical protein